MIVFDVDGVLADTRPLVKAAYLEAGIEQQDEWFGLSWREWLPPLVGSNAVAGDIHDAKNRVYKRLLEESPPALLPCGEIALQMIGSGDPEPRYAVSSGSHGAITALLRAIGLEDLVLVGHGVTAVQRFRILEQLADEGTYIDDHAFTVPANWNVIQYTKQTREELEMTLWMR